MVDGSVPVALWIIPANDKALDAVYTMYSTDSQQPTMKPSEVQGNGREMITKSKENYEDKVKIVVDMSSHGGCGV